MSTRFFALASAFVLLASGCSAATSPNALPQSPSAIRAPAPKAAARGRTRMTLRIHIPRRVRRRNHYVSPLTQSLSLSVVPGAACGTCSAPQSANVGLTPASPNCTPLDNGTTCTITLALAPGNYLGSISTYDGPVGCQNSSTCNALSVNQSFPIQIVAGTANTPSIALYGIPKYLQFSPVTNNIAVTQICTACNAQIYVPGVNSTARTALYALDVDSNLILGPGSPSFTLPAAAPLGWTASVRGNVLSFTTGSTMAPQLSPPQFEIDMQSPACAIATATCTFQTFVFVGTLIAVADKTHNLVHVLFGDPTRQQVYEYATVGVNNPQDVKFDDNTANLIVASSGYPGTGTSTMQVYAPPYTGSPSMVSINDYPTHMAVDQAGDVAISGHMFGSSVQVFAAPSYTPPKFIGLSNIPNALAFEYHTHPKLWIAVGTNIVGYTYPYTGPPSTTVSASIPAGIDIDRSGNLWVADSSANTVTEYAQPGYAAAQTTNVTQATSIDVGSSLWVCGSLYAYVYFESPLQLGESKFFNFPAPCLIASPSFGEGIIAVGNSSFSVLAPFDSYYGTLSYPVNALAVYPSHRFGL